MRKPILEIPAEGKEHKSVSYWVITNSHKFHSLRQNTYSSKGQKSRVALTRIKLGNKQDYIPSGAIIYIEMS
jgi:hypothetical protein